MLDVTKLLEEELDIQIEIEKAGIPDKPIVVYGAGYYGQSAVNLLTVNGFDVIAVCDSDLRKQGRMFSGFRICSIEDVTRRYDDFVVLIASDFYYAEIFAHLQKSIPHERILNDIITEFLRFGCFKRNGFLTELYQALADERSREVLRLILKGRATTETTYYHEAFSGDQYFNELTVVGDEEYLVDGGASIGDTVEKFVKATNGRYGKIYSFEPFEEAFARLEQVKARHNHDERIALFKAGLSDYNGKAAGKQFQNSSANRLDGPCEDDQNALDVVTIDSTIDDKVTFIKLDVEGSELAALRGARQTILRYKPKLAISIYHKPEDIIAIPRYIMELGIDYTYYIRHHGHGELCWCETIFYAIPK